MVGSVTGDGVSVGCHVNVTKYILPIASKILFISNTSCDEYRTDLAHDACTYSKRCPTT